MAWSTFFLLWLGREEEIGKGKAKRVRIVIHLIDHTQFLTDRQVGRSENLFTGNFLYDYKVSVRDPNGRLDSITAASHGASLPSHIIT